jgi:hypothetical protein
MAAAFSASFSAVNPTQRGARIAQEDTVKADDPHVEAKRQELFERIKKMDDRMLTVLKNHIGLERLLGCGPWPPQQGDPDGPCDRANGPQGRKGGTTKSVAFAWVLLGTVVTFAMADGSPAERRYSPAVEQFTYYGGAMPLLPRRYQNHCGLYYQHFICLDHCGPEYQIYYCSKASTGCCRSGHGYCDGDSHLRCGPGA